MDGRPQASNPPFTWAFVLSIVENRLGMWVGRPTYERAVALITGFDMAQTESIHGRMQALMSKRHGTGSIGWPHVLMAEAIGGDVHDPGDLGPLTPEQDAHDRSAGGRVALVDGHRDSDLTDARPADRWRPN